MTLTAKPLPSDQLPLGNLLCLASALFSVDTNEVRKFPDLTLSYPKQLARYQADPEDPQAAARLAWMELLRDAPDRAATVATAALAELPEGHRYAGLLSRVLVDAKLSLAKQSDVDAATVIAHLRDAVRLSTGDFDRLRATMALATRLRDIGQGDDAYLALWRLGLTSGGRWFT